MSMCKTIFTMLFKREIVDRPTDIYQIKYVILLHFIIQSYVKLMCITVERTVEMEDILQSTVPD